MFGNLNKPTFGAAAPNASFGFGSTSTPNANPFGQSQLFGKPATGGFGTPSTSSFGQPANTSLFPSTQAQPTHLFQNANTSFGTSTATQPGFGASNLFGQQQPTSSSLFNTSSTFGQQTKSAGFGFGAQATQPSLFGQQPQQPQTSSIFQPSTSNLFGGSAAFGGQQAAGTVVKFSPVTGTDTMMKNGVTQSINTKHHSITCMKEYENKSFEELRFEDYLANRKGPQQQAGFGATPFGAPASSAPSLFGQPDASKPAFGQTAGFGQPASTFGQNTPGFGLGTQQQQPGGLFGKPTGFGVPTSSTATFGFGGTAQTANPFGANQAAKPFATATQPIFGTTTNTTQQSGFGTGLFGPTTTQNAGSLFGKPVQPTAGFGATQSTSGFSFGPPASSAQTSSLFQPNKPLFGQTTTATGFGQTNTFGTTSTPPFGSSFSKQAAPTFGVTQQTGFGTSLGGLQTQGSSFFGNAAKPGGLFGNTGTTGLFGNTMTNFQPGSGLGLQQQQPQQSLFPPPEQQNSQSIALLTSDPFGDAPHLAGLEPKLKSNSSPSVSATDPKELKALLDPQKKVDMSHNTKLKVFPFKNIRDSLFDGVSLKNNKHETRTDEYVKTNCRRLVLKQRPNSNGDGQSPNIMRTDILKHLTSPEENRKGKEDVRIESSLKNDVRTPPLRLNFDSTTVNGEHVNAISSQTFNVIDSPITRDVLADKNDSPLPSEDEDEHINLAAGDSPSKSFPCGIVCTRPEYYTLPSLEELTQYVDENGSCIVKGFTIGRRGYGNVYFPDELDVAGLNIDELVHFRYREINVYPDDHKKPPVGEGLNRRSQVTLDNVYPRRVDTNTLIKDVSELLQMNFAEKLRKVTVKKGAKFVDYRPETGSWVFKVDHFSRYGFNDSDEESEQNGKDPLKKKVEGVKKAEAEKQSQKTVNGQGDKAEGLRKKDSNMSEAKMGLDDDIFVEEGDRFSPGESDLHDEMYVDDDDFHVVPTDVPVHLAYDPFKTSRNLQVMKSTLFTDDERLSDDGSHVSSVIHYLDVPEDIPQMPMIEEEALPRKRVVLRPKVDEIFNCGGVSTASGLIQNRCYMDLGVFKGKSFKAGWAKGFEFFSLNTKHGEINGELAWNTINVGVCAKDFDPLKEFLADALEIVLEESTCSLDADRVPTFKIERGHTYLEKQTKLFTKLVSKYNDKQSQYLLSIWTLAVALWGPGENTFTNRRHLLSEWLQANASCNDYATKDMAKDIFNLLTVFKILDAANRAMDNRFPNLALLVAQLSLTNRTKLFLQEQIDMWYKSMVANHMNRDVKRIYLLLSGIPVKEDVNIFENVDWKRAFGMHLWYVCNAGTPLESAIDMYKSAFEEEGYAEAPNPPYRNGYDEEGSFDVLYHMLLLYRTRIHRLSSVLNPATHTDDPLDYRLSWLLLQLFLSLNVGIIESSERDKLCTSFSNQLECLGKWEWAIFVLLYLEDNPLKKTLVRGVLDRNLPPETDKKTLEIQDNLVRKMQVPPEWIHTVKGEKLLLQGKYFRAFNHLAHAHQYHEANDVLMEHLVPNLFVNEQYETIRCLIDAIRSGSGSLLHWNIQAGLFDDFLELQEDVISLRAEDLLKLQMKLQSISERIAAFPVKSDQQKLCIAEMSKRCASVYKELCKKSNSSLFKNSYSDFIETLVMPPDFKQNEALYIINQLDSLRC